MLSPNELEALPKGIENQFKNLENRIMTDVVRRLKNAGEMTASVGYQIERLMNLGISQNDIEKLIGDTLQLSQNEISKIYNDTIRNGYAKDVQFIKSSGGDVLPYKENKSLQQLIGAVAVQTNQDLKNITQSMGFAVKQNSKMNFKPIADYYQQTLDGAVLDITSGAFDYDTVLQRTVREMTNSGLRTVDYASGHSNRVDVAARRAVMTGVNQVTARITEQNMEALDTEYVEVSWHSGARPSHQEWQGKIYHWDRGNKKSDENMPDNNLPENSENNIDNSFENGIINNENTLMISDDVINHSNIGEFTAYKNPKRPEKGGGNFSKGGHGQDNINELERRNIEYHIVKEYDNGVRVGYVPKHSEKGKRSGIGQSWFPKDWSKEEIEKAGKSVLSKKQVVFENKDGNGNIISYTIFGDYKGVTVGIFTDANGNLSSKNGTIFPDSLQRKIGDFNA